MEEAIVLYPAPMMGHLVSLVELGQFIISHHQGYTVHVLIPATPAAASDAIAAYIAAVSSTMPAIRFQHLPEPLHASPPPDPRLAGINAITANNPQFHDSLVAISRIHTVRAIFLDGFCTGALPVTSQLNIPAYFHFTSGAGSLLLFLYLPTLHKSTTKSFRELGKTLLHIPGAPPVAASDLPGPFLCRFDRPFTYQFFLDMCSSLPKMSGIFVNSFEVLEPRAIKAIREGLCVPDHPTPPLYCVGPLVASVVAQQGKNGAVPECLTWLDSQPDRSVLYLCFGSTGKFSKEQLGEIAIGLERSGHRFLWVVRDPPDDQSCELECLLPEGFLEKTKERGLVVKNWAPQIAVLNHGAVGGFVTHCGWNSFLEAICGGVPMVAWPLQAEQRFNRVLLVEEMKVAIPMQESEENGLVGCAEVEKRVREIMGSDSGRPIRERVGAFREAAQVALAPGGSSLSNLDKFLNSLDLSCNKKTKIL